MAWRRPGASAPRCTRAGASTASAGTSTSSPTRRRCRCWIRGDGAHRHRRWRQQRVLRKSLDRHRTQISSVRPPSFPHSRPIRSSLGHVPPLYRDVHLLSQFFWGINPEIPTITAPNFEATFRSVRARNYGLTEISVISSGQCGLVKSAIG